MIRNIKFTFICLLSAVFLTLPSCEIDTVENPNGPTLESLENGATLADLRLLASGVESVLRGDMQFYYWTTSIVGREYWDLNGTDPRYTSELLGEQGVSLDNNGFLTTRAFAANYKVIRNAQILITATLNSNASLSQEEENGILGYAKTMQAYSLLLVANRQYQNGVRLDVADPDKLGPFVGYDESLAGISALLDEAFDELSNAGNEFVFFLSAGWDAVGGTPQGVGQFNRAIAARVELYRGNNSAVLDRLNKSYFDMGGDLNLAVSHAFGTGGNDIRNPLFNVLNNDLYTVHPSWLADAEAGDTRVDAKTTPYDSDEIGVPVSLAGLSGDTQVTLYSSDTDMVPIIRNEELVLIYAEANIGSDNNAAVDAINVVRNAAGLADYSGATDDAALLEEVLHQRRYSLFGEGHRWIDLRRTGNLDRIPVDRSGDVVHVQFPRPVTEEG